MEEYLFLASCLAISKGIQEEFRRGIYLSAREGLEISRMCFLRKLKARWQGRIYESVRWMLKGKERRLLFQLNQKKLGMCFNATLSPYVLCKTKFVRQKLCILNLWNSAAGFFFYEKPARPTFSQFQSLTVRRSANFV